MLVRLTICTLIVFLMPRELHAKDGVHEVPEGNIPSVDITILGGSIRSPSNSNDQFMATISYDPAGKPPGYFFMLDGKKVLRTGDGMSGTIPDFTLFNLTQGEAASASTLFGIPLQLRKHPGHRILASFTTDKPEYAPGDPITVTVTIKNISDEPVYFQYGHNGPKDTMFSFAPVNIPLGNAEVTKQYIGGGPFIIETLPAH